MAGAETDDDPPSPSGGRSPVSPACEPGEYRLNDGGCGVCSAGEFCPGGDVAPETCPPGEYDHDGDPSTPCDVWTTCLPGEFIQAPGGPAQDQSCQPCSGGEFSPSPNSETCVPWSHCTVGTYVSMAPDGETDRECLDCPEGTFSDALNTLACEAWSVCIAGEYQASAGSKSADVICVGCETGFFCPGGDAAPVECEDGTWDGGDSSTECEPLSDCSPGQVVAEAGGGGDDRTCSYCAPGSYSDETNASECVSCEGGYFSGPGSTSCGAWTPDCVPGEAQLVAPSSSNDRVCAACPGDTYSLTVNAPECVEWTDCGVGGLIDTEGSATSDRQCWGGWTHQGDTSGREGGANVAVDSTGDVFVAWSNSTFTSSTSVNVDAFLRKLDGNTGEEIWTFELDGPSHEAIYDVAVDVNDDVFVGGYTRSDLGGEGAQGSHDAFVAKLSGSSGTTLWVRQVGTSSSDFVQSLVVDGSGDVYAGGETQGDLDGEGNAGTSGLDSWVMKVSGATGAIDWLQQFGSADHDRVTSLTLDGTGNLFVGGYRGFYDPTKYTVTKLATDDGAEDWTIVDSRTDNSDLWSIEFDNDGGLLITGGFRVATGEPGSHWDAFVERLHASDGSIDWTRRLVGTRSQGSSDERFFDASLDGSGGVIAAGFTEGYLGGNAGGGSLLLVRIVTETGEVDWIEQLSAGELTSIVLDAPGSMILGGRTWDDFDGNGNRGDSDMIAAKLFR